MIEILWTFNEKAKKLGAHIHRGRVLRSRKRDRATCRRDWYEHSQASPRSHVKFLVATTPSQIQKNSKFQKKKKKGSKFIKSSFSESQISKRVFFYHDFTDGGGRDAIAVFGLLEFLDGDGLSTIGRGLDPGQEYETIGALSDLTQQIVLLKPLRLLIVGISIVTVVAVCISHFWTNEKCELCFALASFVGYLTFPSLSISVCPNLSTSFYISLNSHHKSPFLKFNRCF